MYNWLLAFGDPRFALLQHTMENAISRHVFSTEDRLLCPKNAIRMRSRDAMYFLYFLWPDVPAHYAQT